MSDDEVTSFIRSSFRSVWALEVLLLLRSEDRSWPPDELIARLRASQAIVSQSLASLTVAGLTALDERGDALYRPVSEQTAGMVDQAADLYARRPDEVRRIIVASASGGLAAFADAFRFRKD